VESLFGGGGGAGGNRSSETGTVMQRVYVLRYGCDPNSSKMSFLALAPLATDIEHAAQIARQIPGLDFSEREGVRRIAVLKHYSKLDKSLPLEGPVPNDVFLKLHRMEASCMSLELNCSHPAIDGDKRSDALQAIENFRRGRGTFARIPDALQKADEELQGAAKNVGSLLRLYDHLLTINELLSPDVAQEVKRPKDDQALWECGYGLAHDEEMARDSPDKVRPVRLAYKLDGWECLLEAKSQGRWCDRLLSLKDGLSLYFRDRTSCEGESLPANEYSSKFGVTIVGFRLFCTNVPGESVKFTIKHGGILSSELSVDVSAQRGCKCECRIFYVDHNLGQLADRIRRLNP